MANDTRSGAPGIFCWSASPVRGPLVMFSSVVLVGVLVGREPAKMRPSKDLTTCGRWVRGSSWVVVGIGEAVRLGLEVLSGGRPGCPEDDSRAPLVTRR